MSGPTTPTCYKRSTTRLLGCRTHTSASLVSPPGQAPESTAKKAFDFNSTADSRRPSSTLAYHSAHGISNIPSKIRRTFPANRLPLAGRQSTPGLVMEFMGQTENHACEVRNRRAKAAPAKVASEKESQSWLKLAKVASKKASKAGVWLLR